ncbi:MAG: hypothetical protein HN417_09695 [Desulfobacula sp.]|jgi:hypothetical protein|nr:hypothetical protein [Desulfobacula sp.]MBT7259997.1 hypothetical protein [Desulfobacula sp.]
MTTLKNQNTAALAADPPKDDVCIRCPRLGHQINFSYCRHENNGAPCFKTLDCWYTTFEVHAYLKDKLTQEEFQKAFLEKGKPKMSSLFDLIEQAKKRKGRQN